MRRLGIKYILFYSFITCISLQAANSLSAQENLIQQNRVQETAPQKKPIPRFVSLKKDRVNLRRGPSTSHKVDYVFTRKGLPVEIIAEFDLWRRIRDSEGDEGWVYHTLLSGKRNILIAPWDKKNNIPLYESKEKKSKIIAYAETGVLGNVEKCDGEKCLIIINDDVKGWVTQTSLWGVYPDETF